MSFAALVADKTNFIPGKNTKSFISTAYSPDQTRPEKSVAIATNAVDAGDTTITVATGGFDVPLYEGTILACKTSWTDVDFSDAYFTKYFVVRQAVDAATTTIPIYGTTQSAAIADVLKIVAWIPVFSVDTADIGQTATIISANNHSDGTAMQKAAISIDGTVSMSGKKVYNDPADPIFAEAVRDLKLVTYVRVLPNLRGVSACQAYASDVSDATPAADFMTQTYNLAITGSVYKGSYLTAQ